MKFFPRFLVFTAFGLALLALPQYSRNIVPAASAAIVTLGGWLSGLPEAVHGARLQAEPGAYYVEVVEECLGVEAWLMFAAAVFAFSVPVRRRMLALLAGLGFDILYNSVRIACLYRIALLFPKAATWAHQWLFNTPFLLVYMALLYVVATPGNGDLAALRQHTNRADLKFWGYALVVLTTGMVAWHTYGSDCVEALLLIPTKLLVIGLTLGAISDIASLPLSGEGWQFLLPAFSEGADGGRHAATIPSIYIAYLLFPLLSFALCQGLLGGIRRWQWQAWRVGLTVGVLWYGLGLVVTTLHLQSIAAMQVASPFSPYIAPPPYTLLAPPGLSVLFYGSGWLYEVFFVLSNVIGFALWVELAVRNRSASDFSAAV